MGSSEESQLFMNIFAWFSNVSTSVLIVFVNKLLMKATGYGFHFATTLTALHFLVCTIAIWMVQALGYLKPATMPGKGEPAEQKESLSAGFCMLQARGGQAGQRL